MTALAAIALTTPLMLLGMAAVAWPIVAHLLNRRARQRIVFPTIRLLREAAANQSRLFRMRRLLLLALRCLAIILIAWAFARPVWIDAADGGESVGGAAGAVLVIDLSASTTQQESGVSLNHGLIAAATGVLDDLRPGRDVVDIVYAAAQPRAAFGRLIANLDAARADLQQAKPTQERAEITGAIALARSLLQEHAGPKRLIVFSDMQATNWTDVETGDGDVTVVPIGQGTASNVALSRPRIFPARPIAGHPATAAVTVSNYSARPQRVHVEATAGDQRLGARDLNLDPGAQRELSFEVTFGEPRDHAVTFTLGPDDLAIDNRAYAVAKVVERITVALISDSDPADPSGSAFYLIRALSPGDGSGLEVRHLRPAEVAAAALQGVDAVVLADATSDSQALIEFVRGGGGLIVFGGDAPAALRPFTPISLAQPAMRHITGGAWSAAALRHFDLPAQDALSRIPIVTRMQAGELTADALVMLRYADGTPAAAEQAFSNGRVVMTTFGVGPPSELPKHGLFVALLHGLLDQVRPRAATSVSAAVGRPVQVAVDAPADAPLTVRGPDGQPVLAERTTDADHTLLHLPRLTQAGIYTVSSPEGELALIAANVDERESDLRRVASATAQNKNVHVRAASTNRAPIVPVNARPLWPIFIVAALFAIALELLVLSAHRKR